MQIIVSLETSYTSRVGVTKVTLSCPLSTVGACDGKLVLQAITGHMPNEATEYVSWLPSKPPLQGLFGVKKVENFCPNCGTVVRLTRSTEEAMLSQANEWAKEEVPRQKKAAQNLTRSLRRQQRTQRATRRV